jgi:preprotein translocase subunit SecG
MHTLITILHILICISLVITVLLQAGKGASIGSNFGGGGAGQALFGSSGPAGILTKVTAGCAIVFMLTSLYLTYVSAGPGLSSIMDDMPTVKEAPLSIEHETGEPLSSEAAPARKDTE